MQTVTESAKKDLTWKKVSDASERADLERRHPPRDYKDKVKVKLTDAEMRVRVRDLSELRKDTLHLEDVKAAASRALKAHLDVVETLTAAICSGEEERELELHETCHWDVGAVRVVRKDTGELVSERAISADERQVDMFGGDEDEEGEEP